MLFVEVHAVKRLFVKSLANGKSGERRFTDLWAGLANDTVDRAGNGPRWPCVRKRCAQRVLEAISHAACTSRKDGSPSVWSMSSSILAFFDGL